jgi:hypothetical protein
MTENQAKRPAAIALALNPARVHAWLTPAAYVPALVIALSIASAFLRGTPGAP